MQEASFEEALELIVAKDPRYQREAYHFVREALDYTQKTIARDNRGRLRHVTGQELLRGIRDYAVAQFGPMAMMVLEEWGIRQCQDFGEIVFNMVETGAASSFSMGDLKDPAGFAATLKRQADPVSKFLWNRFSETLRLEAQGDPRPSSFEARLVKELNELIREGPIFEAERFARVPLSAQVKALVGLDLEGVPLAQVNRLLLEEAYPAEIAKSHGLLAKTEQDSRADFVAGYDFYEAFRRPFLPPSKQRKTHTTPAPDFEL